MQPAEVTRKMLRDKHNKKNPTQPIPVFPNWVYDRPALVGDFITSPVPPGEPAAAIGNLVLNEEMTDVTWGVFAMAADSFNIIIYGRNNAPGCSGTSSC